MPYGEKPLGYESRIQLKPLYYRITTEEELKTLAQLKRIGADSQHRVIATSAAESGFARIFRGEIVSFNLEGVSVRLKDDRIVSFCPSEIIDIVSVGSLDPKNFGY